ncbi:MAG: LPS export ABC transporter periplasmic protein LptC [Candidatus Eremiobacteraeota bacterium]|nr:LPS export ABC transporter periplasmic protein LptC [Candidatus Eremiobacteraeota bacterium]
MPRAARADLQIGRFTIEFRNSNYNLKTGDIVLTGGVQGKGPDGDFRADRAFGNRERQEITLVGDVQAHRTAASSPITLRSDTATIDERNKTYIATGNVNAIVGARTMSADEMRLDDGSHVFTLNGNVHISEPPGRTLATNQLIYHDDSGDILAPGPVSGTTENGDFRADRADGNVKAGLINLAGGVVLHSSAVNGAPSREPVALYADTLHYDGQAKSVVASGDVKIEQGSQTVTAPLLTLNDATGDLRLSGGVHGAQPPDRSFDTKELTYNIDSGALTVPGPIHGAGREGDFAADRVNGNMKTRAYDLIGHAVVHSSGKQSKGADRTPTTLSADRIHIDEQAKKYIAQGGVVVAQSTRTVSAPMMTFDDQIHVVKMTGGVHATEQPDRSADTAQVIWHSDTGAVLAPSQITGRSTTDSFRADRATGNSKTNVYELQGGVVMRRQRPGDHDPTVLTAGLVRIDGNSHTYTASQNPKVTQGTRVMTGQVMSLDDTTHLVHVSGGVHAEQPQGRTFDTPEMTYNTQTDDFKMLGGIMAIFPLSRATPTPTPTPRPKSSLSPNAPNPFANGAMPAQYGSPTPSPAPTPTPVPTPSPAPAPPPVPGPT